MPYQLQVSLIAELVDAYGNLRGAQLRERIARDNLKNQSQSRALTEQLRDAGIGSELDVLRADARLAATEASLPQLQAEEARALHRIATLLGQRPEQLSGLTHPLLYTVKSIDQACEVARRFGQRVLLTTGSKDLARWRAGLGDKTLLARVLPVADVIAQCAALGFGVGEIFALCGPFSAELNAAFYRQCRADVVITKASGAEGGYQEKVQPCLDAGIPCIVITRPAPLVTGEELLESQAAFARRLARWLAAA